MSIYKPNKRNNEIYRLHVKGYKNSVIANKFNLTQTTVRQIIRDLARPLDKSAIVWDNI